MPEQTIPCYCCGQSILEDEALYVHDDPLCHDCRDEHASYCNICNELVYTEDMHTNTDVCEDCYDDYCTNCCDCGTVIETEYAHSDGCGNDYCDECYENHCASYIHHYSFKPDPIFFGNDRRYFGVELEIDKGGQSNENAHELLDIANDLAENIYIKHDGSLYDGFEIVTHPMTLAYHQEEMPWPQVMTRAVQMGYLSHKTGTCGLHIHVNRDSLGETRAEQEDTIARIMYFFEDHWDQLLSFSRRTEDQLARWANRYGYNKDPKGILDEAKKGVRGRYACINIQNYETVEFRIFRGTLKYNTLIAALQLVNEICKAAFSMSDEEIANLTWDKFTGSLDKTAHKELIQYLTERYLIKGVTA